MNFSKPTFIGCKNNFLNVMSVCTCRPILHIHVEVDTVTVTRLKRHIRSPSRIRATDWRPTRGQRNGRTTTEGRTFCNGQTHGWTG